MEFLSMKRKPASTSVSSRTFDSLLPKKIRFDSSTAGENSFTGEYSALSKRNLGDSYSQSLHKPAKVDLEAQFEQKLAEKQAKILELQQKIIQTEMKLNEIVTSKDRIEHELSSTKDACKMKIKHYEDKIEDLQIEIRQLHHKFDHLAKDNVAKRETLEQLKLVCAEERLSHSKDLAESEQKITDMKLEHDAKVRELEKKLETALWESSKYQLEAEEAQNQLKIREKVVSPCNHQTVIDQQRQVIVEMENALFAQRTAFSQSQEAKLAKIPQVHSV